VRPALRPIGDGSPRWVGWPGRWGDATATFVPGEQPSPRGPAFQPERWDDPGAFHAAEARPCGSGPPGRAWQTALVVLLGAGLLAALLRAVRRSYNRGP
jgi:hypothetical protein